MKKLLTDQLDREIVLRKEANKANEMKTEFLSNVSHDMRTPLNAILGYTDMALKTDSAETTRDYLQKISKAGNTLLSLISDTLDLQRIENGRVHIALAPVSVESIIKTVVASVQPVIEQKNITFNVDYDPESLVPVVTDAAKLQEVIINLMSNATKFTQKGGQIDFIIRTSGLTDQSVIYDFIVRDNGVGISEGFMPKIFEPFSQERSRETAEIGGSGLGLSIVDRLVRLMGGSISVESELGEGTEFVVHMDMERADDLVKEESADKAVITNMKGRRILICEDNSMNMEIAISILSGAGLEAEQASNGKMGLEKFEASAPDYYDAILMDLRMPVMDGYKAAEKIRACDHPKAKTIPIIAMSADAYESDVKKCLEAGMNAHVSKPIHADRFLEKLSKYIY
ncbi:ATP-binding response regulator [Aminicella lysinilytica]|uniref:Stage 0 sporulation protein A homolog n=1 Tax=Aminicella lysinilytica TaxID=433323 RepID=A0A4R6PZS3_9FIRM|nr:ATP-binding protein [Aminicella lysinilytica]TDP54371.1 phospho-acceptor domain-containing protein [Aminicella lysinilytica]